MQLNRSSALPVATLVAGLLLGGGGGAVAATQIGTGEIKDGAITTAKLHDTAVTGAKISNGAVNGSKIADGSVGLADLASSARGAQVIQYVSSGALLDSQDGATITLPGTWDATTIGNSSWAVELVRNSGGFVFNIGTSAPAGEGTADGFYIDLEGTSAIVHLNAPSYGSIDTIRVIRTIRSGTGVSVAARAVARQVSPRAAR